MRVGCPLHGRGPVVGGCSLARAWVPLKTKPPTLGTSRAGPGSVSCRGPCTWPNQPHRVPGSSKAHPGGEGGAGRQPECGRDGSGQDSLGGLRHVASWHPAVALASVSPSVQGPPGLQGDSAALPCCLSTHLGPPRWVGPPGESAVEDRDGKRVGSVSGTTHCPPAPHTPDRRATSRRPGAHMACKALDADVGIRPPLFSPLCVLNK